MPLDDRLSRHFAEISRQRAELRINVEQLRTADGGGTSGGVTDDWKANIEGQLKQLHDGLGKVQNWIIVGIAGPLLAIIGLYAYIGMQTGAVNGRIDAVTSRIDTRLAPVEQKIEQVRIDQARLETKVDLLLARLGGPVQPTRGR